MSCYTESDFRSIFQSPFDMERWRSVLISFFGINELKENPDVLSRVPSDVSVAYYLGCFHDEYGYRIGIFHYALKSGSVVNKIVGLRKFVSSFVDVYKGRFDAALVTFDSCDHWRLSFISDIKGEETHPKRYSFVFGNPGLRYNTPLERFAILSREGISFSALRKAFSVEALSDRFFDAYREHYADFVQYVTGKRFVKVGSKWEERSVCTPCERLYQAFHRDDKKVRDYIKKMMGRITFLHFLQRKGWMNDDLNYMQHLFERSTQKDNFLDAVLEPLFFGILNTKPEHRQKLFEDKHWDLSLLEEWRDIPYLNGGLFEQDADDEPESIFPAELFNKLFNFFGEYNFTMDENDPSDAEIGVDPEMLGKIFENLLEDNKDKGAFYTPKEIVKYMCQEALISYLTERTTVSEQKIRGFVSSPLDYVDSTTEKQKPLTEKEKNKILNLLRSVKICDPAIGSGAFPMGLLNELVSCRVALGDSSCSKAELKRSIICNNIYGVDIEKGAVDIARLRFWLAIVVDEEKASPLPNLDYKIMQGNSLIESFNGVDLSQLAYSPKNRGEDLLPDLWEDCIIHWQKGVTRELLEYYSCYDREEKLRIQKEIERFVYQQLKEKSVNESTIEALRSIDIAGNNQFFLWHSWFSDVFTGDDEDRGFDIVIGNPPYIGEKGHKEIFHPVKTDKTMQSFYLGKMDYFYFFMHLAFNILNRKGTCFYITTNYYLTAAGARKLRKDIHDRMDVTLLLNFGELKLFDNAQGQHNIISVFKPKREKARPCRVFDVHRSGAFSAELFSDIVNHTDTQTQYNLQEQESLFDGHELYLRLNVPQMESIFEKMQKGSSLLGKIARVSTGLFTACDDVFVRNREFFSTSFALNPLETSLLKPLYKNSDIRKFYTVEESDKVVLYHHEKQTYSLDDIPNIMGYLTEHRNRLEKRKDNSLKGAFKRGRWDVMALPKLSVDFTGPKIVCPQRSKKNVFAYNETTWYASADVYYITNSSVDYPLFYLLGLLNSKLYFLWLYHKGKRKGESLELYQKPLSEVPIKTPTTAQRNKIIDIVQQLVVNRDSSPSEVSRLSLELDRSVYDLFLLTEQEIAYIEGNQKDI